MYWGQHVKDKWIKENDHQNASERKRINSGYALREESGLWIEGQDNLHKLVTDHFKNIYQTNDNDIDPIFSRILKPKINQNDNASLCSTPDEDEIKEALFNMNSWGEPGPDGFPLGFYQNHWNELKTNIITWVQQVFGEKNK